MKKLGFVAFIILGVISFSLGQSLAVVVVGYPRALTAPEHYFIAPKWSPDGKIIAVSGEKYTGIYLISFPDGEINVLTEESAAGFGMEWSHSGNEIASRIARFEDNRRYNSVAIFEVTIGTKRLISDFTTVLPGTPKWTQNDRYIFLNGSDRFRLYSTAKVDLKGESISLPEEKAVFVMKDKLKLRDISSQTEHPINAPEGRIINLTVSPDGKKMAYEVMGGHLWASDTDGGNLIDLGWGYAPVWAPDNKKIAYMVTTDDGHRYISSDIFVVNADGTGKVIVTDTEDIIEMHPSWSPDGKWIAYDTVKGQIYIIEVW